jgi:hypothetical protein
MPLLIDKLSNYCIPKDGVLLLRMDSYSSVLQLIVDPFIIKGCTYYGLRRSILIIEAEAGDSRARGLYLATKARLFCYIYEPRQSPKASGRKWYSKKQEFLYLSI